MGGGARSLAILGCGHMGRALVSALLRRGTRPEELHVAERSAAARALLAREFAVSAVSDAREAVEGASVIVLAVKPAELGLLLRSLQEPLKSSSPLIISIAAGVRIAALKKWCGAAAHLMRAMPNRAAFVGAGITGVYAPPQLSPSDRQQAQHILSALGEVVWVESEEALDVVTALSASGPAYFFLLTEAMREASVQLGLSRDAADRLAAGALYGAGQLIHAGDADPARLRAEVTSKGGTTEAALRELAAADLRGTVQRAIAAAVTRSRELASEFG